MASGLERRLMEVLRRHSDEEHPLTQKEIRALLESEYGEKAGRKAIGLAIKRLAEDDDSGIQYTVRQRVVANETTGVPELQDIWTDIWYRPTFDEGQLQLMVYTLAFLPNLPVTERQELVDKIKALGSRYFEVGDLPISADCTGNLPANFAFIVNMELLHKALSKGCKIRARYVEYGPDKQLRTRRDRNGGEQSAVLSPYEIAVRDGRFYLICNREPHDDLAHYRVDRLKDVELLDEPARPMRELDPSLNMQAGIEEYWRTHPYMWTGPCVEAALALKENLVSEAVEQFGERVEFGAAEGGWIRCKVYACENGLAQFALNYSPHVYVLAPESLREKVVSRLTASLRLYTQDSEDPGQNRRPGEK